MAESLQDLTPALIPLIALIVGLFIGRLLAGKPMKGDVGEPGATGPMGHRGEPGKLEPHTHRIRDIAGLAELLKVDDSSDSGPRHARKSPDPDAPGTAYRAVFTFGDKVEYGPPSFNLEDAHDDGRMQKPGSAWKTHYEFLPPGGTWTRLEGY